MVTAYAEAAAVARAAEDRRVRAETALPRAIQRAFDNGVEVARRIGARSFTITSGSRDDRVYNVVVKGKRGFEPNVNAWCTCEGAWLGGRLCQHLALAFLHLGWIDQYGRVLPAPKRRRIILDEATILSRLEKYQARAERQLERARAAAAAEQAS